MAEIYYLEWDDTEQSRVEEHDIFHRLNTGQEVNLDHVTDNFDRYYRHIGTTHNQYGENDLETMFRALQHSPPNYDPLLEFEQERSMSVGDVAEMDSGEWCMCDTFGFTELPRQPEL